MGNGFGSCAMYWPMCNDFGLWAMDLAHSPNRPWYTTMGQKQRPTWRKFLSIFVRSGPKSRTQKCSKMFLMLDAAFGPWYVTMGQKQRPTWRTFLIIFARSTPKSRNQKCSKTFLRLDAAFGPWYVTMGQKQRPTWRSFVSIFDSFILAQN